MIYFSIDVFESFKLKLVLGSASPIECILGSDKLLCLFLCVGISDFNIVAFRGVILLKLFQMLISILQGVAGIFTEVIVYDGLNWSLGSIWFSVRELIFWECDLLATHFKCIHTKWDSMIMGLPVLIILWSCNVSINNRFIIQQFEVSGILISLSPSWLVHFP